MNEKDSSIYRNCTVALQGYENIETRIKQYAAIDDSCSKNYRNIRIKDPSSNAAQHGLSKDEICHRSIKYDESHESSGKIYQNPGDLICISSKYARQERGRPATENNPRPPSWAAAVEMGLLNNDSSLSLNPEMAGSVVAQRTSSKDSDYLHSVRKPLFLQDGWGEDNSKQSSNWDVGGKNSNLSIAVQDIAQANAKKQLVPSYLEASPIAPIPAICTRPLGSQAQSSKNIATNSNISIAEPFGTVAPASRAIMDGNIFCVDKNPVGPEVSDRFRPKDEGCTQSSTVSNWAGDRHDVPEDVIRFLNERDLNTVSSNVPGDGQSLTEMKPVCPTNVTMENLKAIIWSSKQFQALCEMGYGKTDAEIALKNTNMNLKDAVDMLNIYKIFPMSKSNPWSDPGIVGYPEKEFSNNKCNNKVLNSFNGSSACQSGQGTYIPNQGILPMANRHQGFKGNQNIPTNFNQLTLRQKERNGWPADTNISRLVDQSGLALTPQAVRAPHIEPSISNQPSVQQLKLLIQQIQMAVQAGHLNPQILNQPLAPQTLVLLKQLFIRVNNLSSHENILNRQQPISSSNSLLSASVNIISTKQEIQNIQNQISAQQVSYLESQCIPPMPPQHPRSGSPGSECKIQDVQSLCRAGSSTSASSKAEILKLTDGSKFAHWIFPDDPITKVSGTRATIRNPSKHVTNDLNDPKYGHIGANNSAELPCSFVTNEKGQSQRKELDLLLPSSNSQTKQTLSTTNRINYKTEFGIPEFQPGKPWRGMNNRNEDPNVQHNSRNMVMMDTSTSGLVIPCKSKIATSKETLRQGSTSIDSLGGTTFSPNMPNAMPMAEDLRKRSAAGCSPLPFAHGLSNGNVEIRNQSAWLLLNNLMPQIDGSTVKRLCTDQGTLKAFHLDASRGRAMVHYATILEANEALKSLNNCQLGNKTVQAFAISNLDATNLISDMRNSNVELTSIRESTPSHKQISPSASAPTGSSCSLHKASSAGDTLETNISSYTSLFADKSTTISSSFSVKSMHGAGDVLDQQQLTTPQLQPFLPSDLLG